MSQYCIILKLFLIPDTLILVFNNEKVPLLRTNIAWPSDKSIKYQNPPEPLKEGNLFIIFNFI